MNHSHLLRTLLETPEPAPGGQTMIVAPGWDIPIHDRAHCYAAFTFWHLYKFPSENARKVAAQRLAERAVTLGIVAEGLRLVKS